MITMNIQFEDNLYEIALTMSADGDDDAQILRKLYYKINAEGIDPIAILKKGLDNVGGEL